ncbi:MAG: TIM barrel protein, partial [Candidatus Gracilibacteria bacterium]|nr:TIM barrel protein [Candidatus Gracilibacteria bacterium]
MLLLSTSSLKGYGLHKIFIFAKKAGYDGINLDIDKSNFDTLDEEYIKTLSNAFEVPVLSITAQDKGVDEKKVDKMIQMAKLLGSQLVTFSPPHITDKKTEWFTKYLPKIKKDSSLSIAIQNVPLKFWLFVIPEFRSNTLGEIKKITGDTVLNISNIDKSSGTDILKAQSMLGNSLKNVYLSDKNGVKEGLLPGMSGGGTSYLPLESFLMKLKTSNYNGFISLSVNPKELDAGTDEKVIENLEFIKRYY